MTLRSSTVRRGWGSSPLSGSITFDPGGDVAELTMRHDEGVFYLAGDFDLTGVETFSEAISITLEDDDAVVLDLTELTFIDSSGLQAIITLAERTGGRGFMLRNPRGSVARVFSIVRLEDIPGIDIEGRSS